MILSVAAQWFAFGLFSLLAVLGGLGMATTMSMFRSGIFLMASFIGVAGLFILLSADLLGLLQIMMYIGGMLVMVMFMVLFMQDPGGSMMASMKMSPIERLFSRGLAPREAEEVPHGEPALPEPLNGHEQHRPVPQPSTVSAPARHDHAAMTRSTQTEPERQAEERTRADTSGAAASDHPHHVPVPKDEPPDHSQMTHSGEMTDDMAGMNMNRSQAEGAAHPGQGSGMEEGQVASVEAAVDPAAGHEGHAGMMPMPPSAAPLMDHAAMKHGNSDPHSMDGMDMTAPGPTPPMDHSGMNHGHSDMMDMDMAMTTPVRPWGIWLGVVIALGLALLILLRPAWPTGLAGPLDPDSPRQIGNLLMSKYMIGFEGAGLLILLGIMGAVFIQQPGSHPSDPSRAAYVTAEEQPAAMLEHGPLPGETTDGRSA
ncbi:NADH-quinone oxidoreductase subunit J [Deinococcus sp. UYEF24]